MLGNKLLNNQFAKYHIWSNKREKFKPSVRKNTVTQYHQCSPAKLTGARGFQIMVLSTEYSEAVNARYTFQPLWVSAITYPLDSVIYTVDGPIHRLNNWDLILSLD